MKKILQLTEYICYDLLPLIGLLCLVGLGCFLPLVSRAQGTVEEEIFIPEALETLTSDIVGTVEYVNEKGVTEVIYAYDSKVEVTSETPLTYNTVDLGNGQYKIYAGAPFLKTGETWTYVETATTTKQNFDYLAAPEEKILMRFKNFFLPYAYAQTTYNTSAGDGQLLNHHNNLAETWANVHDDTEGSSNDYTSDTNSTFAFDHSSVGFYIARASYPFDTSAIDDTYTVDDAELHLVVSSVTGAGGTFYLVEQEQSNVSTLSNTDFGTFHTTSFSSLSITTSGEKTFTLNNDGKSFINLTGYTKLGLRDPDDFTDTEPDTNNNGVTIYTSEKTSTENDPHLIVTASYHEPPAGTSTIAVASSSLQYPGNFSSVLFIPIVVWFFLILWLFLLYALWPYA